MSDYVITDIYSTALLKKLKAQNAEADRVHYPTRVNIPEVEKAIYYCKKYHADQKRDSGEPFFSHPLEVAYLISSISFKTDSIVAAILHDIIEDTEVTVGKVMDAFGWRVAEMVDMLTRDRPDGTKLTVQEILVNAYNKGDLEVLLIKIVDRLHNIQTINAKSPEKIKKTVNETLKNFLFFSEIVELPQLGDELYNACYNANVRLGVIEKNKPLRLGRDSFKLPYPL